MITMQVQVNTELFVQGYDLLMQTPKENRRLLDLLASDRQHLSSFFGTESYADYALDEATLAGRPQAVSSFLRNLSHALKPQVQICSQIGIVP